MINTCTVCEEGIGRKKMKKKKHMDLSENTEENRGNTEHP